MNILLSMHQQLNIVIIIMMYVDNNNYQSYISSNSIQYNSGNSNINIKYLTHT